MNEQPQSIGHAESLVGEKVYFPTGRSEYERRGLLGQVSERFTKDKTPFGPAFQRAEMVRNYNDLRDILAREQCDDVIERIADFVSARNDLPDRELGVGAFNLAHHLIEITRYARVFLLNKEGKSKMPHTLSDREAWLLAYVVAPLHDMLKYLGTPEAQLIADHEILTAALVRETFLGKRVEGSELKEADVAFVAGVVGDHENIFKELGRVDFIRSEDVVKRGKAVFFILDVMTGVLEDSHGANEGVTTAPQDVGVLMIDERLLTERFIDLYARHVHSAERKVFRPQWGVHTVRDLLSTLAELEAKDGLRIESGYRTFLIDKTIGILREALNPPHEKIASGLIKHLQRKTREGVDEVHEVEQALKGLEEMRA